MDIREELKKLEIDEKEYTKFRLCDISKALIGKKIQTFGWVVKSHSLKKFSFVDLYSQFKTVKCVLKGSVKFTNQTSLRVWGTIVNNAGTDEFDYEIAVDSYKIYQNEMAPQETVNEESARDVFLNNSHMALRLPSRRLFLQANDTLLRKLRDFFHKEKYIEVIPPTIVQTQVEGGATLFQMKYFNENAYLTQSSQLYLETVAPATGSAFCIIPSYRAEKSRTPRHLTEFLHLEGETVDIVFDDLMVFIENMIRYSVDAFYEELLPEILKIHPNFERKSFSTEPFMRLTYKDAIKFLKEKEVKKSDGKIYGDGDDIADTAEKYLCEHLAKNQPIILTHFLQTDKPFYAKKCSDGTTETCDVLLPGLGEVVGGSMRADNYTELIDGFKSKNLPTEPYYWYTDLCRFGPSPHGGFGLGVERLLMWVMNYSSVVEARLYPRTTTRCQP